MAEPFQLMDESYFIIENWRKLNPNIVAGFTTKIGGLSEGPYKSNNLGLHVFDQEETVIQNRSKLAMKLQFPLNQWVCAEQTHGSNIQYVDDKDRGKGSKQYENSIKNCDGIYTNRPNILLALCYADCVPIYFYSPLENLVGMVHAGWKGTVKNIGQDFIRQWTKKGIPLNKIYIIIGPSICKQCYIVDNKVINEVQKLQLENVKQFYNQFEENQYRLDLKGLNKALLLKSGVPESNIQLTSLCTSCDQSYFYSHRRDNGKTGRMMGFIGIREDNRSWQP